MQYDNVGINPALVFLVGLLGSLFAGIIVPIVVSGGSESMGAVALGGLLTSVAATMAVIGHNWRTRHAHLYLKKSAHDARHDPLTGLVNRNALFEELGNTITGSRDAGTVFGVLFLDLDRFKLINDSMGHEAGDELLRIVASRLRHSVRGSDVVSRFGGDEFVIICRDLVSERSVVAVAEQILESFTRGVSINGGNLVVSSSIGVAIARPDDHRTPAELVRDADAAMYKAKQTKCGYTVFDEAQRAEVIDRLEIERDLSVALTESQFVVVYQPLVSVSERRLYGFEALVRWNHPTRGMLGPDKFLEVAEDAGMMGRIGEMVLREACAQTAVWNHLNPEAKRIIMSVNIAEQQLLDGNFPQTVADILRWSNLEPSQLQLEIIEDLVVDHLDGLGPLREIAALGVSLAIDDFGTGQSSLSYVQQFDMVSSLKIDRSFVSELTNANRAIIEAVCTMARAMKLRVVAEGVETEEQLKALAGYGVDIMQGYLFNMPVAAERIDPKVWFKSHRSAAREEGLHPHQISMAMSGLSPIAEPQGPVPTGG